MIKLGEGGGHGNFNEALASDLRAFVTDRQIEFETRDSSDSLIKVIRIYQTRSPKYLSCARFRKADSSLRVL